MLIALPLRNILGSKFPELIDDPLVISTIENRWRESHYKPPLST